MSAGMMVERVETAIDDAVGMYPDDTAVLDAAASVLRVIRYSEMVEELQRTLPLNVCLTNKNVPDSTTIPLECTMGDLRRISALLAKARGEQVQP